MFDGFIVPLKDPILVRFRLHNMTYLMIHTYAGLKRWID